MLFTFYYFTKIQNSILVTEYNEIIVCEKLAKIKYIITQIKSGHFQFSL